MNYRKLFIQNSYVFLTVVTYNRNPILIKNIDLLRTAFKNTKENYDFEIFAICILPDHFHILLKPQNIKEYPKIISSIKHCFSRNIDVVGQVCPTYQNVNGNINQNIYLRQSYDRSKNIWQRRYFEHTIINEDDLNNHIDYIHYNPVKHEFVQNVKDWEFSTFHKFVESKNYDLDWGSSIKDIKHLEKINYE